MTWSRSAASATLRAIGEHFASHGAPRELTTLHPIAAGDMYGIDGIDSPGAIPGWRLPASFARDFVSWVGNAVLFSFLRKARLRIDCHRCTACGICRDGCPVGAIDLSFGRPVIDTRACIACYCCHELCPDGAITLTPLLRRALHGPAGHDCLGRR